MAEQIRTFVTGAIHIAIQPMTWIGRINMRIAYLDKTHKIETRI